MFNEVKDYLNKRFEECDIAVDAVDIIGVQSNARVRLSVRVCDMSSNSLWDIKDILDDTEEKFDIGFTEKLLDF